MGAIEVACPFGSLSPARHVLGSPAQNGGIACHVLVGWEPRERADTQVYPYQSLRPYHWKSNSCHLLESGLVLSVSGPLVPVGRDDSSPAIHRRESVSPRFLVPLGTTDRLTPAITSSAVPMGLNDLYWSRILYPAMNHRATLRGSYGTIPALKLTLMPWRERDGLEASPTGIAD